ncbi:unnamed protein product [Pylaiella littoralis]
MSWSAVTSFSNNSASYGAALAVLHASSVSWSGETTFTSNNAKSDGGALAVTNSSDVSWSAGTSFSGNVAFYEGGAVAVSDGSSVSWSGETNFLGNIAGREAPGGALHIKDGTSASWSGETNFTGNSAGSSRGALYVSSSSVSWTEVTSFSRNTAGLDGGAVVVEVALLAIEAGPSTVSWTAGTTFSENFFSGSGGAIALIGEVYFSAWAAVFEGNTAESSAGAVFLSDAGYGPVFSQANFTSNVSPQGGAVYSVSSGTERLGKDRYPSTYEMCFFTGNRASKTGGAVESVAGFDAFVNSTFEGNAAGVGGALKLSGSTDLTNCEFVNNVSDEDGAAAISNVGALFWSGAIMFAGNDFWCEEGTYLDSVGGDRWSKVCDGCDECCGCEVEEANSVPICSSQLEHTRSEGGDTTVKSLKVNAGYWRATSTSPDVLACYNEDACLGGLTGSPGYYQEGYEEPYCSVCSKEHAMTLSFTCTECVDAWIPVAASPSWQSWWYLVCARSSPSSCTLCREKWMVLDRESCIASQNVYLSSPSKSSSSCGRS